MRSLGLHLLELRELSVRGCVRVTGAGVEAVVEGCNHLEVFDVSQCKNLGSWLEGGGVQRVGGYIAGMSSSAAAAAAGSGARGSASSDMMSLGGLTENGIDHAGAGADGAVAYGLNGIGGGVGKRKKIRFEVVADGRSRAGKY